jgi:hypothetical protein
LGFGAPSGSHGAALLPFKALRPWAAPPVGSSPPSRPPAQAVHGSRVCLSRFVPPSGFGQPLGGLLLPAPCDFNFVKAASASGVRPPGVSCIAVQPHRLSAAAAPSPFLPAALPLARRQTPGRRPRGLDPHGQPVRPSRPRPFGAPDPLLGFRPPRVLPLPAWRRRACPPHPPLSLWPRPFSLVRGPALRSLPAGSPAGLSRDCRPFRGSLTSSRLLPVRGSQRPGLIVSPRAPRQGRPRAARPLWAVPLPLPEPGRNACR